MKRNKFSLSHYKLLTCPMGNLIPLTWYEALPGDTIQHSTSALVRCSPMLSPVMHPVKIRIHHWFVPYRLLWEDWEDFITGGKDGKDASVHPYVFLSEVLNGSLADYLGVPVGTFASGLQVNALPFRAYNLIFNEHYRDQDLSSEYPVSKEAGYDSTTNKSLLYAAWEKDYFTTARPWEQKGNEVLIPIGDTAPVNRVTNAASWKAYVGNSNNAPPDAAVTTATGNLSVETGAGISLDPNGGLEADLAAATGISINDLRLSLAIQRYQEARAQFGSRYVEYLRHLGVRSSDARLQNPEYLGGGRQTVSFSEVIQTAEGTDPVGMMRGHGISAMRTRRYRRFIEEHGLIMSLMSVVPKSIYTQGLFRHWNREVKEDYFTKELQFIGEQQVTNKEIYAAHSLPDDTFGFQTRYDDFRWIPSRVAGAFHDTLDYWHMARIFASEPVLNHSFVSSVPTRRVFADETADPLYIMTNHSIQARRAMSRFATAKTF